MLALPKPSKLKRKQLKKAPVERKSVGVVAGRGVGKGEAVKRREMVQGSKRRKTLPESSKKGTNPSAAGSAPTAIDVDE